MSRVSVCLSVCLYGSTVISKTTPSNSATFSVHNIPVVVAQSSSDDNTIRYVLPVLWMTSCLPVIGEAKATLIDRVLKLTRQGAVRGGRGVSSTIILFDSCDEGKLLILVIAHLLCKHRRCTCICLAVHHFIKFNRLPV